MDNQPLQLGFIGGALDSAVGNTHRIACQMDRRWQPIAACFSTDSDINEATADTWGISSKRLYADWQTMLGAEQGRLDAVVILTPTPIHTEIVIAALKLGFAVICEKALCTTVDDALAIKHCVEEQQAYLAVIYNYTGYPMLREMQHRIDAAQIGPLHQVHVEMPQEGFLRLDRDGNRPCPQSWRLEDGVIPTLSLDLGVHVENMLHYLSGESPEEVVAISRSSGFFPDVLDNTLCLARYSGNLDCQIWFSKSSLGHSNGLRARVFGERGSMEWRQIEAECLYAYDNKGGTRIIERYSAELEIANQERYNRFKPGHPDGFFEAFSNYYADLADSVQEFRETGVYNNPHVFGIDDALRGLRVLDAMQRSRETHAWQKID